MKIAVFSDIHGNFSALEAVMNEINNDNISRIIILGDLITDFAQYTNDVLRVVRSCGADVIRGNREGYLINHADKPGTDWENYRQFSSSLETFRRLTSDDISYIKSLPRQLSVPLGGNYVIRAAHGSPFSEFDVILEDDREMIESSLNAVGENILFCGHTHRPFVRSVGEKTFVNPGSVGLSFDKQFSAHYTVLEYENGVLKIDMREIKYDYAALKSSGDAEDPWVYLCLKSIEDGINYNMRFLDQAEKLCGVWPIPNGVYDKLFRDWRAQGMI